MHQSLEIEREETYVDSSELVYSLQSVKSKTKLMFVVYMHVLSMLRPSQCGRRLSLNFERDLNAK